MKTIILKSMSLLNFKGIKQLTVNFGETSTNVFGDNGTGKSTIFDAFTWLLFGKDSFDRKDFEIKTLDSQNNVIPKIDHEVSAEIEIDGQIVSVRRQFKEKWVKTKGSSEATFSGNETVYFWNEVPMQQREFQSKVAAILDESIFKLITSPFAFNNLKWQYRREVLTQIAGADSDAKLIDRMATLYNKEEVAMLTAILNRGQNFEDEKRKLAARVVLLKRSLAEYPTRIAEVQHNTPEALNFDALQMELSEAEIALQSIENNISNKSQSYNAVYETRRTEQSAINAVLDEVGQIETTARIEARNRVADDNTVANELTRKISEKESELRMAENGLQSLEAKTTALNHSVESLIRQITFKRNAWNEENAKELSFSESDDCCPTCKRAFDAAQISSAREELLANFRAEKAKKLQYITDQGKGLSNEKESIEKEVSEISARIEAGKSLKLSISKEIDSLKVSLSEATNATSTKPTEQETYESLLAANNQYVEKKASVAIMQESMTPEPQLDNSELDSKKRATHALIDELKSKLAVKEQIAKANDRIEQLKTEESNIAQEIAGVEKDQFAIDNFIKFKIDSLEAKINAMFKFVRFKMFRQNINGGEEECCEALINGVPFGNANNAAKINAGLDIINTLCNYYETYAPIFIDNRESVCKLIDCNSQIVNLIVSETDKKLRIENNQLHGQAA